MKALARRAAALKVAAVLLWTSACALPGNRGRGENAPAVFTLSFDPSKRYQVMEGWGCALFNLRFVDNQNLPLSPAAEALQRQMLEELVLDLGLTRFGMGLLVDQIERVNDNDDPYATNLAAFDLSRVDLYIREIVLPARELVAARGERFVFTLGAMTHPFRWIGKLSFVNDDPEEYAEFGVTLLQHFRQFGIEVDYWVIHNEPDLMRQWTPAKLGTYVTTLGRRMRAAGFATRIATPETVRPEGVAKWLGAVANTPGALPYLGQITYHSYDFDPTAGELPPAAPRISVAQWARQLKLSVAQTEQSASGRRNPKRWDGTHFELGLDLAENLWADLTYAQVNAWQQYVAFFPGRLGEEHAGGQYLLVNPDNSGYVKPPNYWVLRQFMRYVRPGAVRVGLQVSPAGGPVRASGFLSPQGKPVIVAFNPGRTPAELRISALPAGEYRMSRTSRTQNDEEVAPRRLAAGHTLTLLLPSQAILTVWQP